MRRDLDRLAAARRRALAERLASASVEVVVLERLLVEAKCRRRAIRELLQAARLAERAVRP